MFKGSCCDENSIIAKVIETELRKKHEPILDVGCGVGDIAYDAMKKLKVIGIDVNGVSSDQNPIRKNHSRIKVDFFEYTPVYPITTLFISHTLQFLDEDIDRLNQKVQELNPNWIICVLNRNDDFLGELIEWTTTRYKLSHPEQHHDDFPLGYKLTKTIPFVAELVCSSYWNLLQQIRYLFLIDESEDTQPLLSFLQDNLSKPQFTINQDILIYEKKG